ncbi:MAG: FeoB-associated Cys-rich membrane protein [Ruminococcus sp.]|nr:FeoB-associated Cys-rich membrane protein [Ruminococcus sp.]
MGTFIVLLIVLLVVGLAMFSIIRDKRSGKGGCSHGCQNCAMHGQCHADRSDKQ